MEISLNAYEVLAIAEEVKRNGVKFYRHLSKYAESPDTRKLLQELSETEKRDAELFFRMRLDMSDKEKSTTRFDPAWDSWLYMREIADSHVFDVRHDPCERLSSRSDGQDILKTAIELEKDMIIFLLDLKRHILSSDRSDKIDKVIRGEMMHIVVLGDQLRLLKSQTLLTK